MSTAITGQFIWLNGQLVPWDEALVHVLVHALHYGKSIFEGVRAYECTDAKSQAFRLGDHLRRFSDSARIINLPMPYDQEMLTKACEETLRANRLKRGYIRPIAFVGTGGMGLSARNETSVAVAVWNWGAYLGDDSANGIRAKTSSLRRLPRGVGYPLAKVGGHYTYSSEAHEEAVRAGCKEAILLDQQGLVTEGPGENIFLLIERFGEEYLLTPPLWLSIMDGITRDTVMKIARDLPIKVVEEPFGIDRAYIAKGAFFCGTAAEIVPIVEIDGRMIGDGTVHPTIRKIQERFLQIVTGGVSSPYSNWRHVYASSETWSN